MKRLHLLLLVLAGTLVMKWFDSPVPSMVQEVSRSTVLEASGAVADDEHRTVGASAPWPSRSPSSAPPSDAFSVRGSATQAPVAEAPPVQPGLMPPIVQTALAPLMPSPPEPTPLRVIGLWGSGSDRAAFIAGPMRTFLGKPGETVLDYDVIDLTQQEVVLIERSTQRELRLPIPSVR